MVEWTLAGLLRHFGLPADYEPPTGAEKQAFWDHRCIDLMREPVNNSGFIEVYPVLGKKPWQAKPYVGPTKQQHLGTFATALDKIR